jgi:hypothetical protein
MTLQRFIIERDVPAVGSLEPEQLRAAVSKSKDVLRQLGPDIQWMQSYVGGDKYYCVFVAKDEAIVRKHAEMAGLPITRIERVGKVVDPTT